MNHAQLAQGARSTMRFQHLIAFFTLLSPTSSAQTTRTVPSPGFPTIRSAIDASSPGDTVLVLPGTYVENLILGLTGGNDVILRSAAGAASTTIDGSGQGGIHTVWYLPGSTRRAVLDGFTIVGGSVDLWAPGYVPGGGIGIHGSSPTIQNCVVRSNYSQLDGGGIGGQPAGSAWPCSPRIVNCVVEGNDANFGGGGIAFTGDPVCAPEIERCTVQGNTAGQRGGGMYFWGSNAIVRDCVISRNNTQSTTLPRSGGAGVCYGPNARPLVANCTIFANVSGSNGGGVKFFDVSGGTVLNCTIVNNIGGSVAGYSSLPGAMVHTKVVNCICWNNGPIEVDLSTSGNLPPTLDMSFTDIAGGYAGPGNINANPRILNLASTNQRLSAASPCVDAGDSAAIGLPASDFEGDPRVLGNAVDMGADEYRAGALFLTANRGTISTTIGGTIQFQLDGGVRRANLLFLVLTSLGGTQPGIDVGSLHLPLNFDNSSRILLGAFAHTLGGGLNAVGGGSASMNLGANLPPSLAGRTLSFAAVVVDQNLRINAFSNDDNLLVVR